MCRSLSEGGRRCRRTDHLRRLDADELAVPARGPIPAVTWLDEPDPRDLWARYPSEIAAEALATILEVRDDEPRITDDLAAAAAPERLHALEFRIKSPSSLMRKLFVKIARDRAAGGSATVGEISDRLTDVVRYTACCARHDDMVSTARRVVDELLARGHEVVEAETSYIAGNSYKGLHLVVRAPSGRRYELQIHSDLSQQVKDRAHLDYEIERDTERSPAERVAAAERLVHLYETVLAPAGIEDLRELGGIAVLEKRYASRSPRG